jgi:tetratricopeptide (TPR) repeat protein
VNRKRRWGVGLLLAASMLAAGLSVPASHARAQDKSARGRDETARGLFQAGKAAFASGNYEDALQYFEQSYARSGRPQLQYYIGLAADRLRQDDKTLAAFRAYLEQVPSADNREEVEGRIRALEKAQAERNAAPASAPAPEQVARASEDDHGARAVDPAATDDAPAAKPVTQRWWFWAGLGAVVIGGVIAAVAVSGGGERASQPFESRTGVTVMTLRSP